MSHKPYDLAEARMRAAILMPYFQKFTLSLIPVKKPGLNTFAVDKWGRLYYDPDLLEKWDIDTTAGVIIHEGMHLFLRHFMRFKNYVADPNGSKAFLWNMAGDIAINQTIRRCERKLSDKNQSSTVVKPKLPDGALYPETYEFPENLTTEEYYDLLQDKIEIIEIPITVQGKGSGDKIDGPLVNGIGGSAADGMERTWEDSTGKGDKDTPEGLNEGDRSRIEWQVAQDIDEHRKKGRGTFPGELGRYVDGVITPATDPAREILSQIRYSLQAATRGHSDFTWKKMPRRQPANVGRLPASIAYKPRVLAIIDTSGSMGQEDLQLAMGATACVMNKLPGESVEVWSGDTHKAAATKAFRVEQVKLVGGGGTDMGALIEEGARQKPAFDVIVVMSDGITPWPDAPVGPRVVACITQEDCDCYPVPSWMTKIEIRPGG